MFLLFIAIPSRGQYACGMPDPIDFKSYSTEELREEGERLQLLNRAEPRIFKVNFIIIRESDGTGGLDPNDAVEALEKMNDSYLDANIRFEFMG